MITIHLCFINYRSDHFIEYTDLGCWGDRNPRAFSDKLSNSISPPDLISKCLQLALAKGYILFALQPTGQCFGGPDDLSYQKYGSSSKCLNDGLGGNWANHVYRIEGEALMKIYL